MNYDDNKIIERVIIERVGIYDKILREELKQYEDIPQDLRAMRPEISVGTITEIDNIRDTGETLIIFGKREISVTNGDSRPVGLATSPKIVTLPKFMLEDMTYNDMVAGVRIFIMNAYMERIDNRINVLKTDMDKMNKLMERCNELKIFISGRSRMGGMDYDTDQR